MVGMVGMGGNSMALIDGVLGDGLVAASRSWRWCGFSSSNGEPLVKFSISDAAPCSQQPRPPSLSPPPPTGKKVLGKSSCKSPDANNRIRPPAPAPAPTAAPAPAHCNNSAPNWKLISNPLLTHSPILILHNTHNTHHTSHISHTIPSHTSCLVQLFSPSSCSLFSRLLPLYLTSPNLH